MLVWKLSNCYMKRVVMPYRTDRCVSQIHDVCGIYNMLKKTSGKSICC